MCLYSWDYTINRNENKDKKLLRLTIFLSKSPKKVLVLKQVIKLAQRYPQSPPLVQCCAKSGKAMPGSGGQEWPS